MPVLLAPLAAALLALPAGAADPRWVWPLPPPEVLRSFAPGPQAWSAGHRGVDLRGAPGASVHAAGAGRVSYAGWLAGRGVLVVQHGALRTTYEPVLPQATVGQLVTAGQVVATLAPGHPGCPAPACLHWGLRRGSDYLDPMALVQPGPVRLLPLNGPVPHGSPVAVAGPADAAPSGAAGVPPPEGPAPEPAARRDPSGRPPGVVAPLAVGLAVALSARRWRRR